MHRRFLFLSIGFVLIIFYAFYFNQLKREFNLSQKQKGLIFIKVKPIQTNLGWGYEIEVDGKPFIHQEFIPSIFGRRGFATKEDAELVGNRAVAKITDSQMSPAISIKDLEELGIQLKPSDTLQIKK